MKNNLSTRLMDMRNYKARCSCIFQIDFNSVYDNKVEFQKKGKKCTIMRHEQGYAVYRTVAQLLAFKLRKVINEN